MAYRTSVPRHALLPQSLRHDDPEKFALIQPLRPGHPAADARGYVKMPNVDPLIEALDMKEAQRAYDANLNVIETERSMAGRTLDLIRK